MKKALLCLLAGLLLPLASVAAEGMWTLDNLPLVQIKAQYGQAPSEALVRKMMQGSVRLAGGCSGSFVSKDGLVLTNHHCVNECIQQLSSPDRDYIASGFLARERKQEVMCPQIELNSLQEIKDVTARMATATASKTGTDYSKAQKAEKSRIEAECVGKNKDRQRCDVVELYHGGRYALYRYKRYQDVRLVFAPEKAAAFFGGDPDNFNFPRYDLDMSLLRAYEDGRPAQVKDYFPLSTTGAQAGELVFVTGHPGSTQRQLTLAQLTTVKEVDLPSRLLRLAEMRGLLNQYAAGGGEAERVSQEDRFSVENSYKALYGRQLALRNPRLWQRKREAEEGLQAYARQHAELKVGDPWQDIASAQGVYLGIEARLKMIESARGFWSEYFTIARTLVRGASERSKPNAERLREFTESALPSLTQNLFSPAPITPDYERLKLAWSLSKLREQLGTDDPLVRGILNKDSPQQVADRLVAGTQLASIAERRRLWDGGAEAIAASQDPFIVLARQVDAEARALRKQYEEQIEAVETQAAERIAKVRFAKNGTGDYPDATFTLRLSYGEMKGWSKAQAGGQVVAPFTDFSGAFERHTGADPFALPASWLAAKDKLDLSQHFNQASTHDIIGGNSGSPMINTRGEVVGLIFDGNIDSLGGAFDYDGSVNRAVSVHSGAILQALERIYDAEFLSRELRGK